MHKSRPFLRSVESSDQGWDGEEVEGETCPITYLDDLADLPEQPDRRDR